MRQAAWAFEVSGCEEMASNSLARFWFEFEDVGCPSPLATGCGITATDYNDAVALLTEVVFRGEAIPSSSRVVVDVSSLDDKYVRPNMGVVVSRGVWFPLGFH